MSESHLRFMDRTRPAGLDKEAVRWALAEIERLRAENEWLRNAALRQIDRLGVYVINEPSHAEQTPR